MYKFTPRKKDDVVNDCLAVLTEAAKNYKENSGLRPGFTVNVDDGGLVIQVGMITNSFTVFGEPNSLGAVKLGTLDGAHTSVQMLQEAVQEVTAFMTLVTSACVVTYLDCNYRDVSDLPQFETLENNEETAK
ncbi:hypothetical protein G168_gp44 [Lactobacillus phage ATCC8014]|uniref:Uncharacterized protein n=1 Tax=Lactobacillus phage ATCC8014 TaxID=2892340 RepID=K4HZK9_9CAUD|nr:hypothetical protein G168_gp44 [Lactobacillus phage ATCC8014]AFU63051.1 hypothetical protein 8014-B1_0044 [Lactobacillus phage ATCC8014]